MGLDTKGDAGSYRHQTMDDAFWIVGTTPNTNFTTRVEETGKALKTFDTSGTSGLVEMETAIPRYEEIDNSSDHPGGQMSFVCMNGFSVSAGGGGINLNSTGNVSIVGSGGLVNIIAPDQASLAGNVISVTAKNTFFIEGKQLYVAAKKTVFTENVQFGKNVVVNGGLMVNGELFASHISTPAQINLTGGAMGGGGQGMPVFSAPGVWKFITVAPIAGTPTGIPSGTAVWIKPEPAFQVGSSMPHVHTYTGPACSTLPDLTSFFEAATSCSGDKPAEAKPVLPCDMTPSEFLAKMKDDVTNAATEYGKSMIGLA